MALLLQDQYLLGCCRSTRVRLRHLQSNEFIWTWSPPPFGNGARLYLEKEPHLEMEPACLEMEPTPPRNGARLYLELCLEMEPGSLFGNGARLFGNGAPGSILEMEPGPTQKRSTALFGTLLGNGARLYLEMRPGSIWKWNPALVGAWSSRRPGSKGSGLRP